VKRDTVDSIVLVHNMAYHLPAVASELREYFWQSRYYLGRPPAGKSLAIDIKEIKFLGNASPLVVKANMFAFPALHLLFSRIKMV
jgi:hypothetical protein